MGEEGRERAARAQAWEAAAALFLDAALPTLPSACPSPPFPAIPPSLHRPGRDPRNCRPSVLSAQRPALSAQSVHDACTAGVLACLQPRVPACSRFMLCSGRRSGIRPLGLDTLISSCSFSQCACSCCCSCSSRPAAGSGIASSPRCVSDSSTVAYVPAVLFDIRTISPPVSPASASPSSRS